MRLVRDNISASVVIALTRSVLYLGMEHLRCLQAVPIMFLVFVCALLFIL
jgi:hypothetical protein